MKKLLLLSLVLLGVSFSGLSQEKKQKMKKAKHQCIEMCKEGKHAYAHGEKKHKCKEACHKAM